MNGLSPLKDAYEREGYVVVRELLDSRTVALLAEKVIEQLRKHRITDGFTEIGQPRFKAPEQPDPDFLRFVDVMRSELTEALFQAPKVIEVMKLLLDTDEVFVHPIKWVRGLAPLDSSMHSSPGVHQDFPELQGSGQQITLWAPLFNVDERSGSLPVYNKKPGETLLPLELALNPSGWQVCPDVLGAKNVFALGPGDVLLFNTFTPHGGATNTGEGWRCSIEARFQPLAEPLALSNFAKPLLMQDWQTFYEGWRTWGFYWRDRHPPIIPFDPSWEHWRDLTAIGEAVKGNRNAVAALEIAAGFGMSEPIKSCAQGLLESFECSDDQ